MSHRRKATTASSRQPRITTVSYDVPVGSEGAIVLPFGAPDVTVLLHLVTWPAPTVNGVTGVASVRPEVPTLPNEPGAYFFATISRIGYVGCSTDDARPTDAAKRLLSARVPKSLIENVPGPAPFVVTVTSNSGRPFTSDEVRHIEALTLAEAASRYHLTNTASGAHRSLPHGPDGHAQRASDALLDVLASQFGPLPHRRDQARFLRAVLNGLGAPVDRGTMRAVADALRGEAWVGKDLRDLIGRDLNGRSDVANDLRLPGCAQLGDGVRAPLVYQHSKFSTRDWRSWIRRSRDVDGNADAA